MAIKVVTEAGGQPADAEDLFQDSLTALWRNLHSGNYTVREGVRLSTYLVQLCRNRWIDRTRKASFRRERHAEVLPERPEDEDAVSDRNLQIEEQAALDGLLAQLTGRCREILVSFYLDRKSLAQIAELHALTEASAKNEKYRCMKRLRELSAKVQAERK